MHEKCGACAAVEGAVGTIDNVEQVLLAEMEETGVGQQTVYENMPDHTSMVVLVDLRGDDVVVNTDKRQELQDKKALSFNVSLPLQFVAKFIESNGLSAEDSQVLISALVRWNVQIARNIIGGDHNTLQTQAQNTLFVIDQRGVKNEELLRRVMGEINKIQHGETMMIG